MPRKLIAANWKENPKTEAQALRLFGEVAKTAGKNIDVVLFPPAIYLEGVRRAFKKLQKGQRLALGAQDAFWEERGAFTSEVGPKMLRSLGIEYVIIGHSERRKWMKETDAMINKKIKLARADGLKVILCVGEPPAVRRHGIGAARRFLADQIGRDLRGLRLPSHPDPRLIIAYEPVWAIGTGRYDKPEDAAEMAGFIKKTLGSRVRVLYGGSVNSKNIAEYVQYKDIDGALVGGASLEAGEFKKIIKRTCRII